MDEYRYREGVRCTFFCGDGLVLSGTKRITIRGFNGAFDRKLTFECEKGNWISELVGNTKEDRQKIKCVSLSKFINENIIG